MKRLPFFLKFYASFLFLSVLVYSCCQEPTKVTIVGSDDLSFRSLQSDSVIPQKRDTLEGEAFSIYVPISLEFVSHFIDAPFVNAAYGVSCDEEPQNMLLPESFKLSCDQEFTYDGVVFPAGTDFSDIPELIKVINHQDALVTFDDNFMVKVDFEKASHVFTIELKTDDGLDLLSTGDVFFNQP